LFEAVAARDGESVSRRPGATAFYARPDIEAGRLIEVLNSHRVHAYDIYVIFQQRRRIAPRLRVFVDFLAEMFSREAMARRLSCAKKTTVKGDAKHHLLERLTPRWTACKPVCGGSRKGSKGNTVRAPQRTMPWLPPQL